MKKPLGHTIFVQKTKHKRRRSSEPKQLITQFETSFVASSFILLRKILTEKLVEEEIRDRNI